jgi:hypothetical protein
MIVIKLEMWPHGDESKAYELGRTYIANVGGTPERGDYRAAVCRKGKSNIPWGRDSEGNPNPPPTRIGHVHDYPRQSYNVWRLVIRALLDCFPEERRNGNG